MRYRIRTADNRDTAAIRELIVAVLAEYGLAFDPDGVDTDLGDIDKNYRDRGGQFRVVVVPDSSGRERIAGCVGLYPLNVESIELRKMYLEPDLRGMGIGRRLLNESIAEARRRGFTSMHLDTASVLEEAIGLYRSAGFRRRSRPDRADRCDQAWALDLREEG